jgi:uncharacterized protein (DUF952 family)
MVSAVTLTIDRNNSTNVLLTTTSFIHLSADVDATASFLLQTFLSDLVVVHVSAKTWPKRMQYE